MSDFRAWNRIWLETKDDAEFRRWVKRENEGVRGRKIFNYVNKYLGGVQGIKTIEVGAGSGVYSFIFAKRGAAVTLVDYSQEALTLASKCFSSGGIRASFLEMNVLKPFSGLTEKFDLAMSFGTIEHYLGQERFQMAKAHLDLVRPGGVVVISVPNRLFFLHEMFKSCLQKKNKWHLGYEGAFRRGELFQLAGRLGLKNVKVCGSAFISDLIRYFYIFQDTGFFRKFFKISLKRIFINDLISPLDDLLGADIFMMGCK